MSGSLHTICVLLASGAAGAQEGARRGDVVIIVDALRASVTIAAGLRAGATRVIPVLTVEQAMAYLEDAGCRIAGERGGARVAGFHYGNSPVEILEHEDEIRGRILVLTTSNGTRCVTAALPGAAGLLIGAAVNARAVARAALALANQQRVGVTVVAAGLFDEPAPEDTFARQLIAARLSEAGATCVPLASVREEDSLPTFLSTGAAALLIELGYAQDVHLCAQIDIWDTVPVYGTDGFYSWPGPGPISPAPTRDVRRD